MKHEKKTSRLAIFFYSHPRISIVLLVSLANLLVIALFAVILMLVTGGTFWNSLANTFILTMSSDGIYDFQQNKDVLELTIKII
ncbi:MAG TPA: hypothetical protein PLR04_02615, partial [Bacilli bacterium]|nr:hypothetical protein [Bacilli bacterium]